MIYPTFGQGLVLWILFSVIGGFFFGARKIITVNVVIFILIIIGFFLGIGVHISNLLIK